MNERTKNEGIIQTGGFITAKQISVGRNASSTINMVLRERNESTFDESVHRPILVLFLAANPKDTVQLRLSEEVRSIDERLRKSEFRNSFQLEQHWAVRYTDLQEVLLRHRPNIVHFSGHGDNSGQLMLEDLDGLTKPISVNALTGLFEILKDDIRCVVLNACFSKIQAEAIVSQINVVIGMSSSIPDDDAIKFVEGFYLGIGYGRSIKTSFDLGCNAITLAGLSGDAVPKLICKSSVDPSELFILNHKSFDQ